MKIKTDFVTNSSSSSFIVAFPKRVRTLHDVIDFIPTKYSETVRDDALQQKPRLMSNSPRLLRWVSNELAKGYPMGTTECEADSWKFDKMVRKREGVSEEGYVENHVWRRIIYDESRLRRNSHNLQLAKQFLETIPNGYHIYLFSYADDSGEYFSEMEHNDIFRKLPRIQISKH